MSLSSRYSCIFTAIACAALVCSCSKKTEEPAPAPAAPVVADVPAKNGDSAKNVPENQNDTADNAEDKQNGQPEAVKAEPAPDGKKRIHLQHDYKTVVPRVSGLEQNPLLTSVADDSFMIIASSGDFALEKVDVEDFFGHVSALVMDRIRSVKVDSLTEPLEKSTVALFQGVFRSFSPQKLKSLGISGEKSPHFVFYFSRHTPVLKVALDDGGKFRKIVESYWEQHKVDVRKAENVSSQWMLVHFEEDSNQALAFHWEEDKVTITVVGDTEHAGQVLPELMIQPFENRTALKQLQNVTASENAAAVGLFDMNAMLNQLSQLQVVSQKILGSDKGSIDKNCVKDMRRVATQIPKIGIQVEMISGGTTLGFDVKLSLDVKLNSWLKELLAWKPQRLVFPVSEHMPVADGYAALPMKILTDGIQAINDDAKQEPFTCLELLNDLGGIMSDSLRVSDALRSDIYVSGVLNEGTLDKPERYALALSSDRAAEMALSFNMIESASLTKKLAEQAGAEEGAEEPAESSIGVYDDVSFTDNMPVDLSDKNKLFRYVSDKMLIAGDVSFIHKSDDVKLVDSPSLVHVVMTEDEIGKDGDKARDYLFGVDISTTSVSVDVTFRYAIQ